MESSPDIPDPPSPKTQSILIVDDDDQVRRGMATYLEDSGYVVIEAENGDVGLELIRKQQPSVILCDLRMPGMDGLELLDHAGRECPDVPFIVVTGQGVMRDAIVALRKGAWDFIAKPITELRFLEHAIERALEKADLLRENRAYRENLEEAVKIAESKLVSNQAKLRSVIASFHEAFVVVIGDDDQVSSVLGPPQLADRYGLDRANAHKFNLLETVDAEQKERILAEVHRVRETGDASYCEIPIVLPAGDFVFELTIAPMLDEYDKRIAVQAFIHDVTRRKAAELEANKLEAQLRQSQKLEAIGSLAGGIAHDFNNILSVIIGYTHMAIQDSKGNDAVQEALAEVYAAGHRASGLIRQILTFSRRGVAEKSVLQLSPLINESVKMLRATLPTMIEFDIDIDPQSGSINGDPTQVNQIMLNLGANAYHAMKQQEHGRFYVSLSRERLLETTYTSTGSLPPGDYVRLCVSDTGCGMLEETVEHIFEPFFTTKPIGEGTGMGLATVHGIVAGMHGGIRIQTEIDAGTTIEIFFPRLSTGTERGQLPLEEMSKGSGHVLFVDDEDKIVGIAEVALSRLGYTVTGCEEPLEALRRFRAAPESFDLVVTDQNMPNLTGLGLAAEIRTLREDIPIVLITGRSDALGDETHFKEVNIATLLQKPFDTYTLAETVAEAMRQREIKG